MPELRLEGFELSTQQERLWQVQGGEGRTPYRCSCMVEIRGQLDQGTLLASLQRQVGRHEILRTVFRQLPGMQVPLQVIEEQAEPAFFVVDLSCHSRMRAEQELDLLSATLKHWPFRFDQGPLFRAGLVIFATEQHYLYLELPALCADAETLKLLFKEVMAGYGSVGQDSWADDDETVQYADIARWQRELLVSKEANLGTEYWLGRRLSPDLDVRLPMDLAYSEALDFELGRTSLPVGAGLGDRVEALATVHGVATARILLSCWLASIWRLSGQSGAIVGVACDGRKYQEMEAAAGLFARYLPVRGDIAKNDSFEQLVLKVDAEAAALATWEEFFSWEAVTGEGQSDQPRMAPFFDFCFDFKDLPAEETFSGLICAMTQWQVLIDRFRVRLSCLRKGGALLLELHYPLGAFRREGALRHLSTLRNLLQRAVERPRSALRELSPLSDSEQHQILMEWNATAVDLRGETTLFQLVAAQAERTPDRVAVACGSRHLTFQAMERQAARLACHLRDLGISAESRVALCAERSLEMVIGILGILKAGGAYVPIDPDYPELRRTFMLENVGASVLLTQEKLLERVDGSGLRIVCLDHEPPEHLMETSPSVAGPDSLAYVIFTSGSSGQPKGVMVAHRAIVNRLLWHQQVFPLKATDRLLQKTPYSFDASIWEIFVPLLSGARLVMAEPGGHRASAYLFEAIDERRITILQLVPSMLSVFLEEDGVAAGCQSLRRVFCGGEVLPPELHRRYAEHLEAELCNLYGPTESSIDASFWQLGARRDTPVPIGRPLANIRIELQDPRGRPVPPGLPGELFIAGIGLARGYIGRPRLTAEKFVPSARSQQPGRRLYRAGDLASYRADGAIEFLGRADQQMKIRGFRIELGEIASTLRQHSEVGEATICVAGRSADSLSPLRLVACFTPLAKDISTRRRASPASSATLGPSLARMETGAVATRLRKFLAERLPEHMLPAAFVRLEELPRLLNGKLDTITLDRWVETVFTSHSDGGGYVAPKSSTELRLAKLWAELLDVERVGARSNFIDLGGHSLLNIQLISRVRKIFQVELPLRSALDNPTVSEMARVIEVAQRSQGTIPDPPLRPLDPEEKGNVPLSFAQQRMWFQHQLQPMSSIFNLVSTTRLSGLLNIAALERSFNELIALHESLRTTFQEVDGAPVQVISSPVSATLRLVDLSRLSVESRDLESQRVLSARLRSPFCLNALPLLRITLLRLSRQAHVVQFVLPHIVTDAWSMDLLLQQAAAAYGAFSQGYSPQLAPPAVQYADFALWQRQWLQGRTLETLTSYWQQQLAGAPPFLKLACEKARPEVQTFRGEVEERWVPGELREDLEDLARQRGATPFMLLLAAFQVLLRYHSGRDDIVVGTDIANRTREETEAIVGFFINQLPLRSDLSGDPTLEDVLGRVREVTLEAYAHQDLPFEKLVEVLAPKRDLRYSPIFQIKINLLTDPRRPVRVPQAGLRLGPAGAPAHIAQLDLILNLRPTADQLLAAVEYNTDLFERQDISLLLEQFEVLLGHIVAPSNAKLSEMDAALAEVENRRQLARAKKRGKARLDVFQKVRRNPLSAAG